MWSQNPLEAVSVVVYNSKFCTEYNETLISALVYKAMAISYSYRDLWQPLLHW